MLCDALSLGVPRLATTFDKPSASQVPFESHLTRGFSVMRIRSSCICLVALLAPKHISGRQSNGCQRPLYHLARHQTIGQPYSCTIGTLQAFLCSVGE